MTIQGVDHVTIVVRDLERNLAFYRDLLGLRATVRARLAGEWLDRLTALAGGEANDEPRPANRPGLRHVALRVDDLDALYKRLRQAGVAFLSEPLDVPAGVVAGPRKRLCYFHGPEGVLLELAEYRTG